MKRNWLSLLIFFVFIGGLPAEAGAQGKVGIYESDKSSGTSTRQEKSTFKERGTTRGKSESQSSTQSRKFRVDQEVSAIPLIMEAISDFEQYLPGSLRTEALLTSVFYHGLFTRPSPVMWGISSNPQQRQWALAGC